MAFISDRLARIKPSPTIAMTTRAADLRAQGRDIISLSAGEPDFDTPENVRDAAKAAIDAGHTRYTAVDGTPSLKRAIVDKFARENGLDYAPAQITVGTGGKQILYNALMATLDDGDEVIVPAPYWVSYPDMVLLAGGTPVVVECDQASGFRLTPDALEAAITPRAKWLILNSPSNPSGAGYDRAQMAALCDVLLRHPQVWVLADDIYEHLVFDGAVFHTLAQVEPRLRERTLTMNGVSKAYAMTGWRIGFGTGPRWLLQAMETLQGQQTSGACSISQHAALAALDGPQDFVRETRAVFERRRNHVVKQINATPGLRCATPGGAFYAYFSCEGLIGRHSAAGSLLNTDEDVALALLDEAGLAVVHGSAFGLAPYIRLAYALDDASLQRACLALNRFCQSSCS